MSVEKRGKRYSARDGRARVGTYPTREAARAKSLGGTLEVMWEPWIVRRRQLGYRDMRNEEGRWELYFANDPVVRVQLDELSRRHAKEWLARMVSRGLAPQTIKNARNIVSAMCADAVDSELMKVNPFHGLRLPRSADSRTHEGWTILDPDEQLALIEAVNANAPEEWAMVVFALHTGARNTELWRMKTEDIDLDAQEVVIRYSVKGRGTKGGKIRRVPLFGAGLVAAKEAVERGHEYAWPSPRTQERRFDSSQPSRWGRWLKAANITRRVRFYDLRHTCATSLLAGWWGRKWSIDEVRQMLGHSTIKMTERYAHLVDDTLRRAGRGTAGLSTGDLSGANLGIRTPDLRFTNAQPLEGFSGLAVWRHYERQRLAGDSLAAIVVEGARLAERISRDAMARARLHSLLFAGAEIAQGGRP